MVTPFNVISWAITVGFILTLLVTLAGMVGWVKFKQAKHLDQLFKALVLEVVALAISIFTTGITAQSKYFNQVSELYSESKSARESGNIDLSLGKLSEILHVSDDALPFKLRSVFLDRADIAFERKLWPQAAESYSIYLELNPNDISSLSKAARSYRELHMYEKAQSLYEQAYKLDSQNWEVLNGLQNCLRRLGGFFSEADRVDVADKYYEQARTHIVAMVRISKGKNEKQYKASQLALARLEWQRERYAEAIAKYEEILGEFPSLRDAREDLAAVQLEYGERSNSEKLIELSRKTYQTLFSEASSPEDKVYPGAGLAEATSISKHAAQNDLQQAVTAVSLAIANNQFYRDDPYAMYSSARLYWRIGNKEEAVTRLKEAIRLENRRRSDPYTLDYVRLIKYERLLQAWAGKSNA